MKLTGFLIVAFSVTAFCPTASPAADLAPVNAELAPVNIASPPEDVVAEVRRYTAVSAWQRFQWFGEKSFGISNLAGSIPGAALRTWMDQPREAGPHWEGFAERYGEALANNVVSNAMEAGLGAAWGEDPRYVRAGSEASFKSRLGHVAKWTVLAPNRDGDLRPAYARYIAFSSSTFISNAWREPSDTTVDRSLGRIGFAFLGRMGSDAFDEFWPDAKRKLFHHAKHDVSEP